MDLHDVLSMFKTLSGDESENIIINVDDTFGSSHEKNIINLRFELPKTKCNFSLQITISNNSIQIIGNDALGCHILRLINMKLFNKTVNNIDTVNDEIHMSNIILEINNIFTKNMSFYDKCSFCNENIVGMKVISCCDKQQCQEKYYCNVTNNCVTEMYNTDTIVLKFLIMILISGSTHPKANESFKPIPCINNVKSLTDFKNIIPDDLKNYKLDRIFKYLELTSNDITFKQAVGEIEYSIIKNGNNFVFSSFGKHNIIKILYPADIEAKFAYKQHLLFHGSNMYSWYPIIKNGLKNMSGTNLQMNGAVHGSGMYFSDSFHFASSYARNCVGCQYKVLGVFDIIDDIEKYKKTTNIYVIQNVEIVLLRYLVMSDENGVFDSSTIEKITQQTIKPTAESNEISMFSVKRLDKEFKKIKKNKLVKSVVLNNTQPTSWNINFNDNMIIKINFVEYPLIPPDIIIVEPGECDMSAFTVDKNNKLILPVLEPKNWTMSTKLNDIMNKLKS